MDLHVIVLLMKNALGGMIRVVVNLYTPVLVLLNSTAIAKTLHANMDVGGMVITLVPNSQVSRSLVLILEGQTSGLRLDINKKEK